LSSRGVNLSGTRGLSETLSIQAAATVWYWDIVF
jgi:hypothetical protein